MLKAVKKTSVLLAALYLLVLLPAPALAEKSIYRVSFNTLAITPDGKKLFVLGEYGIGAGGVLRILQGGVWKEYYDDELLRANLAVNAQGDRGWTAFEMGQDTEEHSAIYRFNGTAFQEKSEKMAFTTFTGFAMSADEKTVIAAGNRLDRKTKKVTGFLMEYKEGKWKEIKIHGPALTGKILALALDASGTQGWAAGDGGLLVKKEGNAWKNVPPPSQFPTDCSLRSLALSKDGRYGSAVGDKGTILNLMNGAWSMDLHTPAKENLVALCMSADGKRRWAFGDKLTILSWNSSQWLIANVQKPKTDFTYVLSACTPGNGSIVYALSSRQPAGMHGKQAVVRFDGKLWKEIYQEKR